MSEPLGIYIHIPFCKSKCPYCDFFSGKATEEALDRYTGVLRHAIGIWGGMTDRPVATVYFGGGTPSILGTDRLVSLTRRVFQCFRVADDAEITLEVNPDSGRSLDFDRLRACGVNRVSVGLQTAVPRELKTLGRIHTAEDARQTVLRARRAGIDNVSLDLMMGIPYQTKESLWDSIDFCVSCGVMHISAYLLKIEEGTPFDALRGALPFADEDEQASLYLFAVEELERFGYRQYEISNFARAGCESRHNCSYWKCAEYIGIGPSAHSFFRGKRFYYRKSLRDFERQLLVPDGAGGGEEEFIMLSLRLTSGLDFAEFRRRYRKPVPPLLLRRMQPYERAGYMELDDRHAAFTPRGFLVSNAILGRLL